MKFFLTTLYAIVCIAFIGFSHHYWTEKTIVEADSTQTKQAAADKTEQQDKEKDQENNKEQEKLDLLIGMTKNWPKESAERFKQSIKEKTPFKIVIAGSSALGGETGWAAQTKANLLEAFGEDITVELMQFDKTSTDFIIANKHDELAALNGDLILLEPFVFRDYRIIGMTRTLENLSTIIETVKLASPDTAIILQPSFPFENEKYKQQIDQLRNYALQNDISFMDHWSKWPSPDSEEIKSYLEADQTLPSEMGHQIWSEFASSYLVSNEEANQ